MKKNKPHIEISAKEFFSLVIEKIQNPGLIPEGDWLPPEIVLEGYIVNNKISFEDQILFENINSGLVRICF